MASSFEGMRWRHLRSRVLGASTLRIALALIGAMAACVALDRVQAVIPLLLGVIASALAETDDNWRGRLCALATTLLCFALIIYFVQLSLPHRAYLILVLLGAAFLLTLLGALGERYRAITSATLIMALYAALATQPGASRVVAHGQEILLLSGAAWYGAISVLWAAAFPMRAVEQNLASLYASLGKYLALKSTLFEPVRGIDLEQRRLALALHNGRVVDALNATKESLFSRTNPKHVADRLATALHQFFVAQDVHERTSSSHEHYELLADTFFHSDVLYRCQRVLALLGDDCQSLAEAIQTQEKWSRDGVTSRAVEDLEAAISHIETVSASAEAEQRARRSLRALAANLNAMSQEISGVFQDERHRMPADTALQDIQPRTLGQFRERLLGQLSLRSPLMRHAIRLSVALAVGYALMLMTGDSYGFWILLTIVFVCQPQYGATLTRLIERIGGTVLGLCVGWALLRLFADPLAQSVFVVAAAVLFFIFRTTRYTLATAGITMFVLLSFNQVSDGYGLIVPRLLDTLAGSLVAGLSVWLVLPCWNSLRLPRLAADTLRRQARYFSEIMAQYSGAGRHDNLAYRIARRDAHNADAALSSALTAAFREPAYIRRHIESGTRFLVLSHTLLNYLSALGAHRNAEHAPVDDVASAAARLRLALETVAQALDCGQTLPDVELPETAELDALAAAAAPDEPEIHRGLRAQLALALRLLPALRAAASDLARKQ
ncbi:MAG: YccS/YhfK family integral rane protein [Proteobacteria bacterium]|nr:YccS/YhfK family integral rane protein [Pseudomonadota bacterium]